MDDQSIKTLRVILLVIAGLAAVIVWNLITNGLGTVHSASRTNKRLLDLDRAGSEFQPTREQYHEVCRDAIRIRSASLQSADMTFYGGGILCVLSLVAFGITFRTARRQIAQPPSPGDAATRAAPEK